MWEGLIAGAAVALGNGLVAWGLIQWSFEKSPQLFVQAVLGGMVLRLVMVGSCSVALFKFTAIDIGAYIGGLVAVYLLVQAAEIALLLRRKHQRSTPPGS
ncbi:MAG: hypothetical protein HYW07_14270 [Candidatus Latescibacteria bacterium]|nr:hypothetical protein [Candidatus Latescibacterota bacterium]